VVAVAAAPGDPAGALALTGVTGAATVPAPGVSVAAGSSVVTGAAGVTAVFTLVSAASGARNEDKGRLGTRTLRTSRTTSRPTRGP
jgi:hypothetical protein